MGNSLRLGNLFGIDVYLDGSFLLLVLYFVLMSGGNPSDIIYNVLFLIPLFGIIVLHELGHALTARAFGIDTLDIILSPLGGVARLKGQARHHWQDLLITLAGPAVNFWLAILLWVFMEVTMASGSETLIGMNFFAGGLVFRLFYVNVILMLFNMLPAFPLDGGRALRSILSMITGDYRRSTVISANVGKVFAVLFVAFGLTGGNIFLVFIGAFVFMAAMREEEMVNRGFF